MDKLSRSGKKFIDHRYRRHSETTREIGLPSKRSIPGQRGHPVWKVGCFDVLFFFLSMNEVLFVFLFGWFQELYCLPAGSSYLGIV